MGQRHMFDNRKPQTDTMLGSLVLLAATIETLEHALLFGLRYATPAVDDADRRVPAILRALD